MKVDLTVTISVILGCAAIVSPIFTSLISGFFQLKLRKLDLAHERYKDRAAYHRSIYCKYLAGAGKCIYHPNLEAKHEYGESYFTALLIASSRIRKYMVDANELLLNERYKDAVKLLETIADFIQAEDSAGVL